MNPRIVALGAGQLERRLDRLVALLDDARAGGMPDAPADGVDYWLRVQPGVARGTRIVLLEADGRGVVQLDLGTLPAARHRAEVMLVLVRRDARRQGLGRALLQAAEGAARAAGRKLLFVEAGRAERAGDLFATLGYARPSGAKDGPAALYRALE